MKTLKNTFIYSLVWDFIKDFNPAIRVFVLLVMLSILAAAFSLVIGVYFNWGAIHY